MVGRVERLLLEQVGVRRTDGVGARVAIAFAVAPTLEVSGAAAAHVQQEPIGEVSVGNEVDRIAIVRAVEAEECVRRRSE